MRAYIEDYNLLQWAGVFLVILLLGLILYGFALWAWNSPAELATYDMLLRMRPTAGVRDDIVILAVDAKTVSELGKLPWSRATHARIMQALQRAGAEYIVYDVLFSGPDTEHPGADRALWQAMTTRRNVFLPMSYDPLMQPQWDPSDLRALILMERYALAERIAYLQNTPEYRYYYLQPPWADFVSAARGVGVAVGATDAVGIVREAQLAYLTKVTYPAPSQQLPRTIPLPKFMDQTVVLQGLPLIVSRAKFEVEKSLTQISFGDSIQLLAELQPFVDIPIDEYGRMKIDYAGPAGSYPNYSAIDLLEGRLGRENFANKIVLVGVTDPSSPLAAVLRTPYFPMPRVEVTANAVGTILNRSYITRERKEALATLLIVAIILGILLPVLNRWVLGPTALVLSLIYIMFAAIVLTLFRHALPIIPVVVLILLSAVAAALLKPAMFVVGEPVRDERV